MSRHLEWVYAPDVGAEVFDPKRDDPDDWEGEGFDTDAWESTEVGLVITNMDGDGIVLQGTRTEIEGALTTILRAFREGK